nr:LysR family transcriptional regulator [Bacilli bacterium]
MEVQWLVLITVAKEKNFTKASQQLHISQPAITQHIKTLEKRLNVQLFDRDKRKVTLTKAGEIACEYAKEAQLNYERMLQSMDDLRNHPSGPLAIGASFTFGEYVLPHVIASFKKKYPDVLPTIQIHNTQTIAKAVATGEYDIGIVEGTVDITPSLQVTPLHGDTMMIIASADHPYATKQHVTTEELQQAPWLIREQGSGTREFTERIFKMLGIIPTAIQVYGSTQLIKESVMAGLGLSVLSDFAIHRELAWRVLVPLAVPNMPLKRPYSIVLKATTFHTAATSFFHDFLIKHNEVTRP